MGYVLTPVTLFDETNCVNIADSSLALTTEFWIQSEQFV